MSANETHSSTMSLFEGNIAEFDGALELYKKETQDLYHTQKEIKELLQITKAETDAVFITGIDFDMHKRLVCQKEIVPKLEQSYFPEYATMNPYDGAEKRIAEKLEELTKRKEHLEGLLFDTQSEIAKRTKEIGTFQSERSRLADALKQMKMRYTNAEMEMRQKLCDIQREITSIITKRNA